jgi:hypothetical protein
MWVHCRGASDRALSKAKGHSTLFEIGRVDHLAHCDFRFGSKADFKSGKSRPLLEEHELR